MADLSRRTLVKAAVGAAAGVASARMARAADAAAAFRIATWGGSWRDSVAKSIVGGMDLRGAPPDYVLGNPDDNLAKLIAAHRGGQIPFDVMECNPDQIPALTRSGLFETVDYGKLPNAAAIPDWAREQCVVCTVSTEDGIAYNEEKFRQSGIAPPTSYLDLKNPLLAGKLAFPDVSNAQHWNAVVGLAMLGGGSESDMLPALKLVNELKPAYFFAASTDLATRFGSGEIWAAPWQVGWAVRLKRAGAPVAMAYPKFGDKVGALYTISVGIVKGTPRESEAYAFINEYLSTAAQGAHGAATGTLPLNPGGRSVLAQDPVNTGLMILSDQGLNDMFQIDWSRLDTRQWREAWNRGINR
ncbi:MAG: extracellular solute-binding protein [Acidisphaera sp.]|nr:extracellular solute-binding protein [Acidisphaera sp.]